MKKKFDWKDFLKKLAILGIPVALQNLLSTTGSMVDTIMIAVLGEKTVGAIGLCSQFSSLMFSCYWGFVGGGMLFMAQYWGAKDIDGMDRSYGLTWTCMMFVATVFGLSAVLFPETVMKIYTDKENIRAIGVPYLRIVGFAYPLMVFSMAASAFLRSTERVRIPLVASIVSVLTNVLFNFLLIEGRFGCPALGVRGAAIATVIGAAANLIVIMVAAKFSHYPYLFQFRKHFRWDIPHTKEFFRKCFPVICNELSMGVANMIISIVLGRQSEEAIAAVAVFGTLEGLFIGFFEGFSNSASILVGKEVGAGNLDTAYERAKRLCYCCGTGILIICLILLCIQTPVLTALGLSGESLRLGKGMMMIFSVIIVIRMMNWVQNDTYRSAGDAVTGTVLEITFMYFFVLPVLLLAAFAWKLPFLMIFACRYLDEPIRFVLMQVHMYSGKWVRPVTPEGQAVLPAFRKARGMAEGEKISLISTLLRVVRK